MKVSELKEKCKQLGLKTTGTKAELTKRYELAQKRNVSFPKTQLIVHTLQDKWHVDPNSMFVWEEDCIIGKWNDSDGLQDLTKNDIHYLNSQYLFQNFRKKIPYLLQGPSLARKRKSLQENDDSDEEEED